MIILQLESEQLESFIRNAVSKAFLENTPPTTTAPTDELLTVQDAAKFLSLSVCTIYGLIHKGEIPCIKRTKRVYFSKLELINYLKQGRKKTLAETAIEADTYLLTNKKRLQNGN